MLREVSETDTSKGDLPYGVLKLIDWEKRGKYIMSNITQRSANQDIAI